MTDEPMNDSLAQQYERWPYPSPLYCLDHPSLEEARLRWERYWPRRVPARPIEILVAGCGTREAALIAHYNHDARVTGIDVSATSLRHQRRLKADYGLSNLSLHHLPIERASALDVSFDLILCHGVLHHLEDPAAGLAELATILRPHGSLSLMVYGAHGRAGIRMLAGLFRSMGVGQDEEGLALVRSTVAALGPHHPAQRFIAAFGFTHDTVFVDTFLNRRDIDYTVGALIELLDGCGLRFQRWANNELYYPDAHLGMGHALARAVAALPEPDVWAAMELFHATNQHYVIACPAVRPDDDYRVDFFDDSFMQMVPLPDQGRLRRFGHRLLDSMNPLDSTLFRFMDGTRTIAAILDAVPLQGNPSGLAESARRLFRGLWRKGLIDIAFVTE
ncbi:class I SAM-dependent methyltransferase [Candidatus Fermentibacteria bacterium]|nr:class I SAM-dependent methyltransferase [Candidatus Fermentibacteria bacterium]